MRARWLVLLLLIGVALGILLLASNRTSPEGPPPVPSSPSLEERRPAAPTEEPETSASTEVLEGEGEIRGHILRDGNPAAATVELWRVYTTESLDWLVFKKLANDPRPLARTVSGEDGAFSFEDVPFRRQFEIRATAKDGTRRSVYGGPHDWEPIFEVEIELIPDTGPRHRLRGVALWSDGRPFRGYVSCFREGDLYDLPFQMKACRTDEEGRFVLPGLMPGEVMLLTREPERFWSNGPKVEIPYAGEYRHVVDADFPYVEGRVVDALDDTPVPGARIDCTSWRDPGPAGYLCKLRLTTDQDGRFQVPWSDDLTDIAVRAEGYVPFEQRFSRKPDPFVLRLGRPLAVSGRIVSAADGSPVPGVPVFWRPYGAPVPGEVRGGQSVSGEDGSFELPGVPPGKILIYALGKGWVQEEIVDLAKQEGFRDDPFNRLTRVLEARKPVQVEMTVVRCAAVRGRVLTIDGAWAPGVTVSAWPDHSLGGPLKPCLFPKTVTDEEGAFEVDGLLPGMGYHFEAQPKNGALSPAERFVAAPGETVELEIHLLPDRWLMVTVAVKGTGAPVEGAEIGADHRGDEPGESRGPFTKGRPLPNTWKTDAGGQARVGPLPPGRIGLWVRAEGYRVPRPWEGFEVSGDAEEFRVELTPQLCISGRFLLPDGSPVADGSVEIAGPPSQEFLGRRERLGQDGAFVLWNLSPGTFALKVIYESGGRLYSIYEEVEAGSEDLVLRLKEGAGEAVDAIILRVRDREGRRVFMARAYVVAVGRRTYNAEVFEGLLVIPLEGISSPICFEIYEPRSEGGRALPLGAVYGGPHPPAPRLIDVEMPPEMAIAGKIVEDGGQGVAGVYVRAQAVRGEEWHAGAQHASAVSDVSGAFRLGQLAEGAYRIEFTTPEEYAPLPARNASAGSDALEIVAIRGVVAVVTVLDENNAAVRGMKVKVLAHGAHSCSPEAIREGATDDDGKVRLAGLDPSATYRLVVFRETKRNSFTLAADRSDWRPLDIVIRLHAR